MVANDGSSTDHDPNQGNPKIHGMVCLSCHAMAFNGMACHCMPLHGPRGGRPRLRSPKITQPPKKTLRGGPRALGPSRARGRHRKIDPTDLGPFGPEGSQIMQLGFIEIMLFNAILNRRFLCKNKHCLPHCIDQNSRSTAPWQPLIMMSQQSLAWLPGGAFCTPKPRLLMLASAC